MGWKFLSSNDNIHNEAHYVASNIPIFFWKMLNSFVVSLNSSFARERYVDREGAENISFVLPQNFQASALTKSV